MRRDIVFGSQGENCVGWLYVPDGLKAGAKAPAIVMAGAMTSVKEITLPGYAERFAAAGFVTLVFDFRFWGGSGGKPRNQVIPYEQLQDIRNAITWLAEQPEVDANRMGGWGISLGGGHMYYLAAFDRRLKAVVATASAVNNVRTFEMIFGREGLQGFLAQIGQDRGNRFKTGATATTMQAWGKPGEMCAFPQEEALEFYTRAKATVAPHYENLVTMESVEKFVEYNPDFAIGLASPTAVLFVHPEHDLVPIALVREVYQRSLEPKKFVSLDCSHSDVYDKDPWMSQSVVAAIDWFKQHLN
ncbi:MAG: alpha/beta hydrolase [Chloroflexota bacterium]